MMSLISRTHQKGLKEMPVTGRSQPTATLPERWKWGVLLLLVALAGCVLLCLTVVGPLRYRYWLVAFDGPKDAMLKTWHPRLYLVTDRSSADGAEQAITLGMITYKRMLLEEDVAVSAVYVVVDRKQLLSGGPVRARSYILWNPGNGGFVGNQREPTIKEIHQEFEVSLVRQEDGQLTLKVNSSDRDLLPFAGSHCFELVK